MFRDLTTEASFTRIEEEVRRLWKRQGVPEVLRDVHRDSSLSYQIFQQPLTVTGRPQAGQVRLLATADLFARFRTMQGHVVRYQTGWACHGLDIEVAVERMLGEDAAWYDMAQFNTACRDTALRGVEQGEHLREHLGVWYEPSGHYLTMTPQAIGFVWGALRRLWVSGRLKHEHRIVSICPRCATPLSATEASQHPVETEARAIWLHLPWDGEPNAYFLVWTSIPWTLLGMVALAVDPDAEYVLVERTGRTGDHPMRLVVAKAALDRALTGPYQSIRSIRGKALRGARYRPPFTFLPADQGMHRVVLSTEVGQNQGSGLLPITPGIDALSAALAQEHGLPTPRILDNSGSLTDSVTRWRGLSPADAEPLLIQTLQSRGLLLREEPTTGQRAVCPYCETLLLSLSRPVWEVETGAGAWVVGRDRAWGTPLPVWVCEQCREEVCLAGLDDLARRTGLAADQIEPHRPAMDRLAFPCESCGGTMQRVAAVVDAAFEGAVLPVITAPEPRPADLAVGLGDKQVGWLSDLNNLADLLQGGRAWDQALSLPQAEYEAAWDSERMPPAAALRWAAYTATTPDRAEGGFLRQLRQLVDKLTRAEGPLASPRRQVTALLDRWLMARFHQAIAAVTDALESAEPRRAAEELAALVTDLLEWYVPLRPGGGRDVVETLGQLLAPFTPHLAEAIYRHATGAAAHSVHGTTWPEPQPEQVDAELLAEMVTLRQIAALGLAARSQAHVAQDRPLPEALVHVLSPDAAAAERLELHPELAAEVLEVGRVRFTPEASASVTWQLALSPERAAKQDTLNTEIEAAFAALDPELAAGLVSQLWDGLSVSLEVAGRAVTLLPDEATISVKARPGWTAAAGAGLLVVLDVG
jgi:isoleucyl-tRNA synthetase